ncbi:MAG: zinc-binding dehydrogenase, partial [Lachnospiraceae bacterium]|nr:zinc-binding dehydrogenase [Lachnospiraceae bacterium]
IEDFNPLKDIPNGVYLTGFDSDNPTQKDVDDIFVFLDQNNLSPSVGAVYDFTNIREALMDLDAVKTNGKIVVMMDDYGWGI